VPVLIREAIWTDKAGQLIYIWGDAGGTEFIHANNIDIWELTVDRTGEGSWKFEDLESLSQIPGLQRASAG
jgi:hypothetical protein